VHVVSIAIGNFFAAVAAPTSHGTPGCPGEGARDGPSAPPRILLPEIARIVLLILIANFVAALIAIVLPLTAVLDAPGLILSKVIAGCARPADIGCARSAEIRSSWSA